MKKGKNSKMPGYKNFKVTYGTVDSKNLKSIYLNIQSWAQPIEQIDSPLRSVSNLCRQIKHTVYENLDASTFNEKFIVDLDLRYSGIQLGKKSFMNLECFLYPNKEIDFKSYKLKTEIKKLVDKIIKTNFQESKVYTFTLTKKEPILL